jgi:hypothetical protein
MWEFDIHGHPRYTVTNVRLSLIKCHFSAMESGPEKGRNLQSRLCPVTVRRMWTGDAGESPCGSGDW